MNPPGSTVERPQFGAFSFGIMDLILIVTHLGLMFALAGTDLMDHSRLAESWLGILFILWAVVAALYWYRPPVSRFARSFGAILVLSLTAAIAHWGVYHAFTYGVIALAAAIVGFSVAAVDCVLSPKSIITVYVALLSLFPVFEFFGITQFMHMFD